MNGPQESKKLESALNVNLLIGIKKKPKLPTTKIKKISCSIIDCDLTVMAKGFCTKHYKRILRHGDPSFTKNRKRGTGAIDNHGYVKLSINKRIVAQHVLIAETVLGKSLPANAVVHHADENRSHNAHDNLVICQDGGYHQMLHARKRSYDACGHVDWLRCRFCKKYGPADEVRFDRSSGSSWHIECHNENQKKYRRANRSRLNLNRRLKRAAQKGNK